MTSTAEIWKKRVASWRASGLTADVFSRGQPWSPNTLRWWSSRLRHEPSSAPVPVVRMAQLMRAPAGDRGAVVIEVRDARLRIVIEPGAAAETVAAILGVVLAAEAS